MAMTDKEQSFLDYMVSHGFNCATNIMETVIKITEAEKIEDKFDLTNTLAYHNGYLEACNDFIEAYKHMFGGE